MPSMQLRAEALSGVRAQARSGQVILDYLQRVYDQAKSRSYVRTSAISASESSGGSDTFP